MTILNNIDRNSPIAFCDSGLGGLTVLSKVKQILPSESYIYYGDTAHMPYGEKSKEQLLEYTEKIFKFFESKNCKAVVMACNTTSSVIYEEIKDNYSFRIFPIVQSVSKILSELPVSRLGIFATRATINSHVYQKEIAKYNSKMNVFGQYCPEWVPIVENNEIYSPKSRIIIKEDFEKMMENNPEKIVLGCTHYPFLLDILSEFAPRDLFIDPALPFAQYIKTELIKAGLTTTNHNSEEEFYVSSNPESFKNSSKMFYELNKSPELLNF